MSIASAIQNAQGRVADCYTAISNKGGTLPATQNLSNMPTAISSIPTGSTPVINSLSITPSTSAQTFNSSSVDGYKPVSVSAVTSSIDSNIQAGNIKNGVSILGVTGTYTGGGGGYSEIPSYQVVNGVAKRRELVLTGNEFSGITLVDKFGLMGMFTSASNVSGLLSFPDLEEVKERGLGSFLNLASSGDGQTGVTTARFPKLKKLGRYGIQNAFNGCIHIEHIYFNSIVNAGTNAFMNMLISTGTNTVHTLHFPSNFQTAITSQTGYPTFGGTSGYVTLSFDLPATS